MVIDDMNGFCVIWHVDVNRQRGCGMTSINKVTYSEVCWMWRMFPRVYSVV